MSPEATTPNPAVQAIIGGTAPQAARLAAAGGLLPLAATDLLEVLVALRQSDDAEIAQTAAATLESQDGADLLIAAKASDTSTAVLSYLATLADAGRPVHEALLQNNRTPDEVIAALANSTTESSLLEFIALNQQRLIRAPAIIDAILANPARTAEAERRARETRREFFEKERGAKQIAEELRARGKTAAAEFFETAELAGATGDFNVEDAWLIAEHIEVSDADIDDSWLPAERFEELAEESVEERAANVQRIIEHERLETGDLGVERISLIRRIMFMNVKDRVKLGMKGDREARGILVRDPTKIVAAAVIKNPRISEHEIENIAAMRTVSDEVLRLIGLSRTWARSYPIIHNLTRNPRTPIPTAVGMLPRIRTKDLLVLSQNRNVSEAVRRQAQRLAQVRSGP